MNSQCCCKITLIRKTISLITLKLYFYTKIKTFTLKLPSSIIRHLSSVIRHPSSSLMFPDLDKKSWQIITILILAFIWGSSFILMKRGLESFANDEVAAYRIFIAALVLFPFSIANFRYLRGKHLIPLICSGLLGNAIPAFLFTKAQTVISSSFSGILNSLTPLFTLLIGSLFFQIKVNKMNLIGVLLGLIGAIGLLFSQNPSFNFSGLKFGTYVIIATLCYALSVNIIKRYLKEINPVVITSLALFTVGPFCGLYLLSTTFFYSLKAENALMNLGYISILGIAGTSLAVIIFNALIKKTTPVFASSVTYIIPIVAIFWGWIDLETIKYSYYLWISVVFLGIYMVNQQKN